MPKLLNRRTFCVAAAIAVAMSQTGSLAAQPPKFTRGDYERPLNSDIVLGMAYTPTNFNAQTPANSHPKAKKDTIKANLKIEDLRYFATETAIEKSFSTHRLAEAALGYHYSACSGKPIE